MVNKAVLQAYNIIRFWVEVCAPKQPYEAHELVNSQNINLVSENIDEQLTWSLTISLGQYEKNHGKT